jgi:hypothetical protein
MDEPSGIHPMEWNSTCTSQGMIQSNPILRNLCSQLVSVFQTEEREPQPAICGNLEEIGESTALVLTENPIHPGTKVRIDCNMRELRGVTESCEANEWLGFFVEIRLDADSRWSPQWFTPEHLLTLALLGCSTDKVPQVPEKTLPARFHPSMKELQSPQILRY